ncbi:anthranilate synthase component I family protein [Metabacillus sp. RGM 3146]|uniref:anthranilate synthase component I family protein n=1 Tax=Metabacillus sp. RGM 3146 TaxID=3401092 RepID=UPI003B995AA8
MTKKAEPVYIKIPYYENFFHVYKMIAKNEQRHIFLESGKGGRYSIAGIHPWAIISGKDGKLSIEENGSTETKEGHPLRMFKEWLNRFERPRNPELPDYQGGAIGFISYDAVRMFEKLPSFAEDDLQTPELYFLIFNDVAVYDHQLKELWLITHLGDKEEQQEAFDRLEHMRMLWTKDASDPEYSFEIADYHSSKPHFSEQAFMEAVEKIRDYISQGDVFQVNLSVRQEVLLSVHPIDIYGELRRINPSPYMAYMQTPDFQIVCGSPELLVKKKGNMASTRPIAGTRSRGKDDEEDFSLVQELIQNEKERAEHIMLVDLERNDLGRVCEYGTVEVDEFMAVEKYSHVMHIVSNVKGLLREGAGFDEIIESVFPGGTITGAPKVRTMEIIEELEPARRGIYTGSIGWIDFSGDLELNIIIRTLFAKEGKGYIQAGAGIVIDSNPRHEYKESLKKAMAVKKAAEVSKAEQSK